MTFHRKFFYLTLLFFPTQLGYHYWPDWAMVLGRRVDYLAPMVYLTDIFIFLTIGIWFVPQVVQVVRGNPKSQIPISKQIQRLKKLFPLLMLVVMFIGINSAIASNHFVAMYKWAKILEFGLLGWYMIKTKPHWSLVIGSLSLGVFYSSILAIVQFFLQHSVGGPLWLLGERTFNVDTPGIARIALFGRELLRPYGTFPHPNVFGGFLAATLPLIIYQLTNLPINQLTKWKRIFYVSILPLGAIALLLTFSRSAIVVGILGIGISIWNLVFRERKKNYNILFLVVSLLFFVLFNGINKLEESVVVRQQLNVAAVRLWQRSPLVGVGLGNFLVELPKALPSRTIYFLQPVHNIYLLVMAETGIVGLIFFLLLLYWALRHVVRDMRQVKYKNVLFTDACRMSLVSIFVLGLIDHYPLTLQQGQLLFTIILSLNILDSQLQ